MSIQYGEFYIWSRVLNVLRANGFNYAGTWNAATNIPNLQSGVGVKGNYYVVSISGNTNLDGITDWETGDWAIFNGTVWQKVDYTGGFVLEPATSIKLGGVKIGSGINVTSDGTISITSISSQPKYSSINDNDYVLGNNQSDAAGTWTFAVISQWIQNKNFTQLNATTFTGTNVNATTVTSNNVNATTVTTDNVFASLLSASNTVGNDVLRTRVNGDSFNRFIVDPRGQLLWSQGNVATIDTRLHRPNSTPNTLTLDDGAGGNADLIVTRNITCNTLNASSLNAPIPSQIDANKIYTYRSSVGTKSLRLASNSAVLTSQNVLVNNNTLTAGVIDFFAAGEIPSLSNTSVYLVREINGRFSGISSYLQGTPVVSGQFNKVNFDKAGVPTGAYQIDIWLLETAIPVNLINLNYFGVNPYLDVNFSSINGITRDSNNAIVTVGHIIQDGTGTPVPNRSYLKFAGTGVSVTDSVSGETLVTINGNGDVSGQPSSIERGIAFFSDTTGKQINDSPWIFAGSSANTLYAPNGGTLQFLETATPREIILSNISGDTNLRMVIENTGLHKFSAGSGFYDLTFFRSAPATLKLEQFDTGGAATLDTTGGTFLGNTLKSSIADTALTLTTTGVSNGADIILDPGTEGENIFRYGGANIARVLASGLRMEDYVTPSSSSPMTINLGNSFSNILGQMPKLILRDAGVGTYGIGVSGTGAGTVGSQQDYTVPANAIHSLYIGGARRLDLSSSSLSIYTATNQLVLGAEGANKITITAPVPAASSVYTIPDAGTVAQFLMTAGNQTIFGAKNFRGGFVSATSSYSTGTVSQSGTIITGVGTSFTSAMSPGILVFADGTSVTISTFISITSLTSTVSQTKSSQAYTLFYGNIAGSDSFGDMVISKPTGATVTPAVFDMGNSYSSVAGSFPKIRLFNDGSNYYGFGVSSGQLDYISPANTSHVFYSNGLERARINPNGAAIGNSNVLPSTATGCYAIGNNITIGASRSSSVAMGNYINVNATGAMGLADNSTTTSMTLGDNTMSARFSGGYVFWSNSATSVGVQLASSGTSWVAVSDVRKKKEIIDVDCLDVYSKVKQLPVITYKYKDDDSEQIRLGTSANDFNDLFGEQYIEKNMDSEGYNLISSADVTYVLLATVKELQNKVENLEKTLH